MDSSLKLYSALLALFAVLSIVVAFNVVVWGLRRYPTSPVWHVPEANPARGKELIAEHSCGACHVVPGVRGARGMVGPRLDRVAQQIYIAGVLPNTPQNLTYWISNPKDADPRTAMPDLNVSEADARDMAAYLYKR